VRRYARALRLERRVCAERAAGFSWHAATRAVPGGPGADPAGIARHAGRQPQFRYHRAYGRAQADERGRRRQLMETADLSHHISRRFNEDLERVRSKLLGMGGFVEPAAAEGHHRAGGG